MKNLNVAMSMAIVFAATASVWGQSTVDNPKGIAEKIPSPEELRIAVQGICPVSGLKLGEHGDPVAVKIGQERLFLCCKSCASGEVNPKHWATIHANFARAQRICPVMENPLPKDAKWTIVEGHIVFVCCPPCIEKIEADPATYLAKVDGLYAESLKREKEKKER